MENLINQLTSTHDKDAQVKLLQEIGKKLLKIIQVCTTSS